MSGLKKCILTIVITITVCICLVGGFQGSLPIAERKPSAVAVVNNMDQGIIVKEGEFPPNVYYQYADEKGIYHTKYNNRKSISMYDMESGVSNIMLSPLNTKNYIHAFAKYGDNVVWEEDRGQLIDSESLSIIPDWKLYLKKDDKIFDIDGGKTSDYRGDVPVSPVPETISIYEGYFTYKTYDIVPGDRQRGVVIKLYDINKEKSKVIFSLLDIKDKYISNPYVYKEYVVWNTGYLKPGNSLDYIEGGCIYVYSIKENYYVKISNQGNLTDPIIWEEFIISLQIEDKKTSIVMLNIKTGNKKVIAESDYSLSPKKEIQDYSAGGGYITWNTSHADSVFAYDILTGKFHELKVNAALSEEKKNSLLNIRLFGKKLLYTDHLYNSKDGKTVSEISRFLMLK